MSILPGPHLRQVDERLNVTDIDDRITAANANISEVEVRQRPAPSEKNGDTPGKNANLIKNIMKSWDFSPFVIVTMTMAMMES